MAQHDEFGSGAERPWDAPADRTWGATPYQNQESGGATPQDQPPAPQPPAYPGGPAQQPTEATSPASGGAPSMPGAVPPAWQAEPGGGAPGSGQPAPGTPYPWPYGQQPSGAAYPAGYGQPGYPPTGYEQPSGAGYGQPGYPPTGYEQTPYGQPGYGTAPGYPVYPYATTTTKTNGMAVAAMIVSIVSAVGLTCYGFGGLLGVVGAILGHVARRQVRERNEAGSGMALAGIIVGWIATGLALIVSAIVIVAFVYAARHGQLH